MRIIDERKLYIVFSGLNEGDTFVYLGSLCMKTTGDKYNAVLLKDGKMAAMKNSDPVVPVNAEVIIKDDK